MVVLVMSNALKQGITLLNTPAAKEKRETCVCKMAFKTKRGLSQHERIRHPAERNEKRSRSATKPKTTRPSKGLGIVWRMDEKTIIRTESSLRDNPHLAQQVMEHLPNKTLKQIRDKRRELSYKARLDQLHKDSEQLEIIASSSDSEPESYPAMTGFHISETEDYDDTEKEVTLQRPNQIPLGATEKSAHHATTSEHERTAENLIPTEDDPPLNQEARERRVQTASPSRLAPTAASVTPPDEVTKPTPSSDVHLGESTLKDRE
jgi:hypothetical protein